MRKALRVVLWVVLGALMVLALVVGAYVYDNLTYFDRDMSAVWKAGFVEKQATIDGSLITYGEGPARGPALLLIHGQVVDWKNYAKVLPELAEHFHVFAVDCPGHGGSARVPEKYSAAAIGGTLAAFIKEVIGEPVVVSGHSSGGLLTAWLAANEPGALRGIILEDPPLFTTLLPRALKTWNFVDLATSAHDFLRSGQADFVAYNATSNRFLSLFGGLQPAMTRHMLAHRVKHPNDPVRLYYMPPLLNEVFRGLNRYDPRFGEAFYRGTFDEGFDHAQALGRIKLPAVLIHANWGYDPDGILMAAMDDQDAERARSLLGDVKFVRVDSGHGFHFEKPKEFVRILLDFRKRLADDDAAHQRTQRSLR